MIPKRERFRLSQDTFGVVFQGGKPASSVNIPSDSEIKIVGGTVTPQNMIEIEWEGVRLMVFAQDFQDR